MQCTFLSSEVAVVFVLQIQSNEWPKHSYIFCLSMSRSRFIQMRLTLGYDPLSRNHQWLWTTTFASHTSGGKRWSLPCWFDCTMALNGLERGHLFDARLMDCYFSAYIPTEAKTPSPDEINKLQSFSQQIAFLFDVLQVWFKLEGCVSWWHSNLLRSQDRCVIEAVRKVTLGATLLLYTGLVCWWGTQSSVGSVDHLKRFCKMLVDWCHPCCFCQHFEVQLVTTRADKLSMQLIRIFCSDGTDLAVKG